MKRREFLIGTAAAVAVSLPAVASLSFEEPTQRVWHDHEFDCADWIRQHYGFDNLTVHQEEGLRLLYTGLDFKSRWPRASGKTSIIQGYLLYKQFIVKDRIDRNLICNNKGSSLQNFYEYRSRVRSMPSLLAAVENKNIVCITILRPKSRKSVVSIYNEGGSNVYFSEDPYTSQQKIYDIIY